MRPQCGQPVIPAHTYHSSHHRQCNVVRLGVVERVSVCYMDARVGCPVADGAELLLF